MERLLLRPLPTATFTRMYQSDDYVLKDGEQVLGIAYVIETYGLIYNKALLNDYFDADWSTV